MRGGRRGECRHRIGAPAVEAVRQDRTSASSPKFDLDTRRPKAAFDQLRLLKRCETDLLNSICGGSDV